MGYYGMGLDKTSKEICMIVVPWELYQYKSIPMGMVIANDVFQSRLLSLFRDLPCVLVYIGDIAIICNGTFEDHLEKTKEPPPPTTISGHASEPVEVVLGKR